MKKPNVCRDDGSGATAEHVATCAPAKSILFISLFAALGACQRSDYGQACPELLQNQNAVTSTGDPTLSNTQEVVAQDATFPCEQLICVATGGRSGYCSGKCLDDAGCPNGFECRVVQTLGTFANIKYCVWKQCTKRQDCGGSDFCCNPVTGGNPNQEYRLCDFSNNGKCG